MLLLPSHLSPCLLSKPTYPLSKLPMKSFFQNRFSKIREMATSSASQAQEPAINTEDLKSFHDHLKKSNRVLALLGAGLSASSGLPTFRGAGGLWRTHDSISLATPEAFDANPDLVWQFYGYRRHMALQANPNPAHYALAELARRMPNFMTLSQNVDGLSQRANHPREQLQLLHGSLFEVKCVNKDIGTCNYSRVGFEDPVVPALAIPTSGVDPTSNEARKEVSDQLHAKAQGKDLDISDAKVPLPTLQPSDLPKCPECRSLLRPGVVWFGEALPWSVLENVDNFLNKPEKIDLIMVIGTSSKVYPAAGYVDEARDRGARVCVVNMDENDLPAGGRQKGDWFFKGDAAQIVPRLLEPVIGKL
jgi:NAD+-dependent protein deacetylase sirtuin 5